MFVISGKINNILIEIKLNYNHINLYSNFKTLQQLIFYTSLFYLGKKVNQQTIIKYKVIIFLGRN